jgi:hypothetical protein
MMSHAGMMLMQHRLQDCDMIYGNTGEKVATQRGMRLDHTYAGFIFECEVLIIKNEHVHRAAASVAYLYAWLYKRLLREMSAQSTCSIVAQFMMAAV